MLVLLSAMACQAAGKHATPTPEKKRVTLPTDAEIARDVERKLEHDRSVPADKILVSTSDGIVTLNGTVENVLAKERALRLAETVRGVRTVIDRVQTRPTARSSDAELKNDLRDTQPRDPKSSARDTPATDDEIESAISSALALDPRAVGASIEPESLAGVVVLRGVAPSIQARDAAEQIARSTTGVSSVTNRIRVQQAQIADRRLQNRVISALARNPDLDSFNLTVEVMGGVVFLGGTVDSSFQKVEAERVASQAAKVSPVDNRIRVARGDNPLL